MATAEAPLNVYRSAEPWYWIVSATSEDLLAAARARRFREDLYHRLALVTLRLPPLRERGEDVVQLAEHFLTRACEDYVGGRDDLRADRRAITDPYRVQNVAPRYRGLFESLLRPA